MIAGNVSQSQVIRALPVLFEIVVVVVLVLVVNVPSTDVRHVPPFHEKRVRTCPLTWLILMHYVSPCANILFVNVE
jgi:hypothetical protein